MSVQVPCNLCAIESDEVVGTRDRQGRRLRSTICPRCGLVWTNPRSAGDALRTFYARDYRRTYRRAPDPVLRQTYRSGLGAIERYRRFAPILRANDRVLDVGAGGGELVFVLRHFGFDARGIEPEEAYAEHARTRLGLPIATGFAQDLDFHPGSFDAITLFHVLEHVEDPVGFLARLRGWLSERGRLVAEVPNVESRVIAPGQRFHYAHLYNFNPRTLEWTGRLAGFTAPNTFLPPDGGTVLIFFERAAAPLTLPDDREENYRRVIRILNSHTSVSYLLQRAPYQRIVWKLRRQAAESRALRKLSGLGPKEMLESLLR
jgi:SAM-dependent methyltransferase